MTGVVTPHLGVGATAGDEDCWDTFKDLYYPIIKEWHGYDAETQVQLTPHIPYHDMISFDIQRHRLLHKIAPHLIITSHLIQTL